MKCQICDSEVVRIWKPEVFFMDVCWLLFLLSLFALFVLFAFRYSDYPAILTLSAIAVLVALFVIGSKRGLGGASAHTGGFALAWLIVGVAYLLFRFARHLSREGIGRVTCCVECGGDGVA